MSDPVSAHYANLLARHYSWMFGLSFDEKVTEQRTLLEPLLENAYRGLAVDLGCGPGFQSIALAQLGFSPILALDTSAELLAELSAHSATSDIQTHRGDILSLSDYVQPEQAAAIVCMGDTLTHLSSPDAVRRLFSAVAAALAPGGLFILTWRDLTPELKGPDRFIPVRATGDRIMTCFLEYLSPTTVQVHDLVYTRNLIGNPATAAWTLEKSSYPKLRLSPNQVSQELTAANLEPNTPPTAGRLSLAVAKKTTATART
jgi:SAM-dependent methyltransferase